MHTTISWPLDFMQKGSGQELSVAVCPCQEFWKHTTTPRPLDPIRGQGQLLSETVSQSQESKKQTNITWPLNSVQEQRGQVP